MVESPTRPWSSLSCFESTASIQVVGSGLPSTLMLVLYQLSVVGSPTLLLMQHLQAQEVVWVHCCSLVCSSSGCSRARAASCSCCSMLLQPRYHLHLLHVGQVIPRGSCGTSTWGKGNMVRGKETWSGAGKHGQGQGNMVRDRETWSGAGKHGQGQKNGIRGRKPSAGAENQGQGQKTRIRSRKPGSGAEDQSQGQKTSQWQKTRARSRKTGSGVEKQNHEH